MPYLRRGAPSSSPLVFLHGLFGSKEDWLPVISELEHHHHCIAIDLPLFMRDRTQFPSSSILIGYSMGGRIALPLAPFFSHIILISAHLNQLTEKEKEQRKEWNSLWEEKLLELEPFEFFTEWYHQPLFSSLSPTLRKTLITMRAKQEPSSFIPLFSEMNLLKQSPFVALPDNVSLIYGEKDRQYEKMYRSISSSAICIPNSGHVCHLENPIDCASAIGDLCLAVKSFHGHQ